MTFLKADQFNYAVKPHEYEMYFRCALVASDTLLVGCLLSQCSG